MKRFLKNNVDAFLVAFIYSFMLFMVEPLTLYLGNVDEFWFNFGNNLKLTFVMFISIFLFICLGLLILKFITKKLKLKEIYYKIFILLTYILFIYLYIQGNFLSYNLPRLDGDLLDFSIYKFENILSYLSLILIFGIFIFLIIKFKNEKITKVCRYISFIICFMLTSSLISVLLTTKDFGINKDFVASTSNNIHNYSSNNNLIILTLDAVDSRIFYDNLIKSEYKDLFNDFTYYPDTVSLYPYTRDSVPHILSGIPNLNEKDFSNYYTSSIDNSKLLEELYNKKYDINIYETEFMYYKDGKYNISNMESVKSMKYFSAFKNELKYLMFKYLPYNLKEYSRVQNIDFNACKNLSSNAFNWSDVVFTSEYTNNPVVSDKNEFKFIHIEGAHVPFHYDDNLNIIKHGTYDNMINSSIKTISIYLNMLKENNIYDNSSIVILADHGYELSDGAFGRQNPILFIKGKNEKHDMIVSNKEITYEYLSDAFISLLDNKQSEELFNNIDNSQKRRFLFYKFNNENYMDEYIIEGKAWETNKMRLSGNKFNR